MVMMHLSYHPKEYTIMHLIIISYHDNIITTGTMALVSLGSALFTINSTFGFLSGPMVRVFSM